MHFKLVVYCLSFGMTCQVMPERPITMMLTAASQTHCVQLATRVITARGYNPRMLRIICLPVGG